MSGNGPLPLAGRVALVTGASRNIGRATALALAGSGASVLVHGHQDQAAIDETAGLIVASGGRAVTLLADLADPGTAKRLAAKADNAFGRLDILVNNAAIRPEAPFAEITYESWRQVFAIGLDSIFLLSQAALPALSRSDQAAIVNIGGLTGHTGARDRAHVVTVKAALSGLTKAMAHDLGGDGITVNGVAPGLIDTKRQSTSAVLNPSHHARRTNLVGRRGLAEEVAAMVRHLAGPDGRYVTGQMIHVNGGAYLA